MANPQDVQAMVASGESAAAPAKQALAHQFAQALQPAQPPPRSSAELTDERHGQSAMFFCLAKQTGCRSSSLSWQRATSALSGHWSWLRRGGIPPWTATLNSSLTRRLSEHVKSSVSSCDVAMHVHVGALDARVGTASRTIPTLDFADGWVTSSCLHLLTGPEHRVFGRARRADALWCDVFECPALWPAVEHKARATRRESGVSSQAQITTLFTVYSACSPLSRGLAPPNLRRASPRLRVSCRSGRGPPRWGCAWLRATWGVRADDRRE